MYTQLSAGYFLLECLIDLSHLTEPYSNHHSGPATPIVFPLSVNALAKKLGVIQGIFFFLLDVPHIQLTDKSPYLYIQSISRIWSFSSTSCYILVQAVNHLSLKLLQVTLLPFLFLYNLFSAQQSEYSSKIKTTFCCFSAPSPALVPHVTQSNSRRTEIDLQDSISDLLHLSSTCWLSSRLSVFNTIPYRHRAFVLAVPSLY